MIHSIKHCFRITILLAATNSLVGFVLSEELGKVSSQQIYCINMVNEYLHAFFVVREDQRSSIVPQTVLSSINN